YGAGPTQPAEPAVPADCAGHCYRQDAGQGTQHRPGDEGDHRRLGGHHQRTGPRYAVEGLPGEPGDSHEVTGEGSTSRMSKAVDRPGAEEIPSAPGARRIKTGAGWGAPRLLAADWPARQVTTSFVLPAVLLLFFLSIFPLLVSAYLSLTRFQFVPGGFALRWVGLANYGKLLVGIEQSHFLGVPKPPTVVGWLLFGLAASVLLLFAVRGITSASGRRGVVGRAAFAVVAGAGIWLAVRTLTPGGFPGTLLTTLIYVVVGIIVQYWLGLWLAFLCAQEVAGR